ncbi:MAG TPA: urease subunit beta, partial [Candidatus Limnocylindrales bacterium]
VDPLGRGAAPSGSGPGAVVPGHRHEGGDAEPGGETHPPAEPEAIELEVRSVSTRPIRISSHFPFDRVNRRLEFDRAAAVGYRLDVSAGSSVRWAPGETKQVRLVRYGGEDAAGRDPRGAGR